jgi:hypothetical protein
VQLTPSLGCSAGLLCQIPFKTVGNWNRARKNLQQVVEVKLLSVSEVNPLPASLCNCLLTCAHCTTLCTSVVRLLQFAPLSCLHSGLQAGARTGTGFSASVEGPEQFERGPAQPSSDD